MTATTTKLTARQTVAEVAAVLAAALTDAGSPAEHLGDGHIYTWLDVADEDNEGTVCLHVHEDGATVTVATTYYDHADEDQPGRPVDDEDHATFPVGDVAAILQCLHVLTTEHGAT